jgi:hypothetical protein
MSTDLIRTGLRAALVVALAAAGTTAQLESNIDPARQHAWSENGGWSCWYDADAGTGGVIVEASHLGGYVWAENLGWIFLGDGAPANGVSYANVDSSDFGVNLDLASGGLSGMAWSENAGWINFDTSSLGSTDRAQFDPCTHDLSGYAWAENLGWLNLGTNLSVADPTDDLGFALAGTGGLEPDLCAYGVLSSGNSFVLLLREALPLSPSVLFVNLAANPTPFKGGMLVPVPVLLQLDLFTNSDGLWVLQVPSGTGTIAVDVVLQGAVLDPGAVAGVSLSNALTLHMLP